MISLFDSNKLSRASQAIVMCEQAEAGGSWLTTNFLETKMGLRSLLDEPILGGKVHR